MEHSNIKYGILLTKEQMDFMKNDRYGFHRMKALETFATQTSMESTHYEKPGYSTDLDTGQFAMSKVELSDLWNCDRKTAVKVVKMFNDMGMLTSKQNNRTTIHTVHFLAFWIVDEARITIKNPHYKDIVEYTGDWQSYIATKPEKLPPPYNAEQLIPPTKVSDDADLLEEEASDSHSDGQHSSSSVAELKESPSVIPSDPADDLSSNKEIPMSEHREKAVATQEASDGQQASRHTPEATDSVSIKDADRMSFSSGNLFPEDE